MRSGFDPASYDWATEYYQVSLRNLRTRDFTRHTVAPRPALVARAASGGYRESVDYRGQAFDETAYELGPGRWSHDTCTVCRFRVETGHTYWESSDSVWLLCDECHDHVMAQAVPAEEGPA